MINRIQIDAIMALHNEGVTSRDIAQLVLGSLTKKSTVNNIINRNGRGEARKAVEKVSPVSRRTSSFRDEYDNSKAVFSIQTTKGELPDGCSHIVLPDMQIKPDSNWEFLYAVGKYIVERRADVIVCLGDFGDMPSLSSYDKGKKRAEGKRLNEDIDATVEAMRILLQPLYELQQEEISLYGKVKYKPKMVLTLGNHEDRINRHVDANPELHGFVSTDNLRYADFGWEVAEFLQPVVVNGVGYVHFASNPFTGKPYGGTALNILQKVGTSMTVGHKQTLDVATRNLPTTGQQQWFICAGACYTDDEHYKGPQGNYHWRGLIVKHNVINGAYSPMFVDLDYLEKKFI